MKLRMILIVFLVGLTSLPTMAQDQTVTLKLTDVNLYELFDAIRKQTGLRFLYNAEQMKEVPKVSVDVKDKKVKDVLTEVLSKTSLTFEYNKGVVTVVKKEAAKSQEKLIQVSGRVVDEKGNPIPGATIVIHGTTQGVASDMNGRYVLPAKPDDVLKVTFVGYKDEVIPIKGKTSINIQLEPKVETLEEATVVAFGEQKKESVVSAITTVRPESLRTSNSDLTASFAGRIPGMVAWQTGGIPGALTEEEMNTKFYIRGITSFQSGANIDPLILLDGVEASKLDLARMDPEDIETFTVMKDASATAMYGARGANGVILVTTKKGKEGSVYTSVRYEVIATMPTSDIDVVDPVTYMKAYNEALMSRDPLATPMYSAEQIKNTGSKKYPSYVYPANDWYDILFKKMGINHHMGINIRGGSKVVQYYASLNHNRDGGMLKTDRLNQFDVNIRNNNTVFRVNLTVDLTAGIKLLLNSYTSIDKYHGPLAEVTQAYSLAFNASPVDFAPTYPEDDYFNWPHIRFGRLGSKINPYAEIQQGYKERSRFSTINKAEYIHNLSPLLKGLELRANVSWSQAGFYSIPYKTTPYYYSFKSYDHTTGKLSLNALNPEEGSRILKLDPEGKQITGSTQLTGEVWLLHTAAWKDHTTSYTAVFSAQESSDSSPVTVQQGIVNRNLGLSMRLAYGYKNKYFLEGSFGYNGTERFAKKHRMGFFPAAGAAWVISSENFMQSTAHWLPFLKLRFSWGKVGNDGIIKNPRFVYITNIDEVKWRWSPRPSQAQFDGYRITSYENQDITWEIAEQYNLGLETKLFNGIFEFTFDAYQQIRHNILSNRTVIPAAVGLGHQPMDNIGKVRSRGFDFAGKIQHAFTPDLWMILNGTITYSKATYMKIEQAADKPWYQDKIGHDISQQVGYIAEGLFRDQAEIDNAPVQGGDVMPGDIRYRDLNDDGVIDVRDATYIGFPETPRLIYGFNGFINYKGFEFNFAFQGSGQRGLFMDPSSLSPFSNDHALLQAIYDDHWSTDNMTDRPFWPRLSTSNIVTHNPQENMYSNKETPRKTTYFMREVKFLRCQSLELAYNLPKRVAAKIFMKNLKVFARVNNPFIISDFKIWDVELGNNGFNYPIQKTYSLGVNLSF